MFEGLRSAIYGVKDLSAAKAWYAQLLGQDPYFDQPFYVGFDVGGYELGLVPVDAEEDVGCVTYWGVPDADEAITRLIAFGATPRRQVQDVGGEIRLGSVTDPDGNIVGVIFNPHFRAK
jgi:predicted enzyme related to lactoylglutathione lyase